MAPVVATKRTQYFVVSLENRDVEIHADTIDVPATGIREFVFTLGGETVAKYNCASVLGWRIAER